MRKNWNNKGRIIFSVIFFVFSTMLLALCCILYPDSVSSGPYLNSAHGNTSYGVNRTATFDFGYSIANCAHCHEQHAMIGGAEPIPKGGSPDKYAIFAKNFDDQLNDFCFWCHKGAGSLQVSFDRTNYNYSYWFGGDHVNHTSPNSISDAFNPAAGSSHNLQDIYDFITGLKGSHPNFPNFPSDSNPCNACHNPHLSKRSFPVVRPGDRNNIWGDAAGEHMSDFAAAHGGNYQAPYWYGSTTNYEPDGSPTITDGSNVPDYVTFCSDCHNATNVIWSTTLVRNLNPIDWTSPSRTHGVPGDYHGSITRCFDVDGLSVGTWRPCGCIKDSPVGYCRGAPVDGSGCCLYSGLTVPDGRWWGDIRPPYETANYPNFILNCTDCHESHGAVHGNGAAYPYYFLRKTVNGHYNMQCAGGPGNPCSWEEEFCRSCHHHRNSTKTMYIPEFDQWKTVDGGHCGFAAGCLTNCHVHNADNNPCYSCSYCNAGGRGHQF